MADQKFDYERSKALAVQIGAEKKQCYRNALLVFLSLDELKDAHYVEGWAVSIIAFAHGWIETADGTVLDPTLALSPLVEHTRYFPAVTYTQKAAWKIAQKSLPAVENDGKGGRTNRQYIQAERDAYDYLLELQKSE